jgi:Na+-translocating ferredoxin:NAD+ oxidoreductase RNF subunit RnfB
MSEEHEAEIARQAENADPLLNGDLCDGDCGFDGCDEPCTGRVGHTGEHGCGLGYDDGRH